MVFCIYSSYNLVMITPKAKKHLSQSDPQMAKLVKTLTLNKFELRENSFRSLIRSIVSQQLSTKAARSIYAKLTQILGSKKYRHKQILSTSTAKLRTAGLSSSKVEFIKGVAIAMDKKQLDFRKIKNLTDEEVIAELIKLKGIGRWTAEMFLLFSLGRPDVFSLGDWGLRNAITKIYNIKIKDLKKIQRISDKWKPYRSLASLYLWASLNNQ